MAHSEQRGDAPVHHHCLPDEISTDSSRRRLPNRFIFYSVN